MIETDRRKNARGWAVFSSDSPNIRSPSGRILADFLPTARRLFCVTFYRSVDVAARTCRCSMERLSNSRSRRRTR